MRQGIIAIALVMIGNTAHAQYNNQALDNWYRLQDQRERESERMQEQQRWMQEQREQNYRDLYRNQYNNRW